MKDMKTNMKKIWKRAVAVAAAAVATGLVACTDDLETGNSQAMDPSEVVCFTTGTTVGESRDPFTRHAGYLEETAEEWELTGIESSTRAAVETSLYDYFDNAGVRIFLYDGDWAPSNTNYREIPEEPALSSGMPSLPGTFNADGLLSPTTPILWNSSKDEHETHTSSGTHAFFEHFRAYAFAPLTGTEKNRYHGIDNLSAAGYTEYEHGGIGVPPSITYTVPDEPADQVDLIAGCTGELDGDLCSTVPMTFRHVLSAVDFRLGFEQTTKVKSLTISGVYKKGTGSFNDSNELTVVSDADGNGNGTPGDVDDLYTYSFTWKNGGNEYKEYVWDADRFASGNVLTDGDNTLMMMPQTLPEGAYVTLVYCVQDGGGGNYGSDKTITCDISGFQWKPGHRYIYTLKETPAYDIYFDLAAGPVKISKNAYGSSGQYEYSGKVYVGGVATNVQGLHNASNKYYIYQSTGTAGDSYDKDHTGWESALGTGTCRIPNYPNVMSPDGSIEWSEYVTDNTDSDVLTQWNTRASAVGRQFTTNTIDVIADMSLGKLDVDVVIDNIWIKRAAEDDGTTSVDNPDKICAIRFMSTSTSDINNTSWKGFERVTLKLKGVNKANNIMFRGFNASSQSDPDTRGFLKVTSYYGDESFKGTLLLMPESKTAHKKSFPSTRLGCGMYTTTSGNQRRGMRGLFLSGGTIFASNHPYYSEMDSYTPYGLIGATNDPVELSMTGGRVTAVAYSMSSAFGAGCGMSFNGAKGIVSISGGELYAYNFGSIHPTQRNSLTGNYDFPMVGPAIGGGGSMKGFVSANESDVTEVNITGGRVKAYSVGAIAIGGGSSQTYTGGHANISISGNAIVEARSVSGYIYNEAGSVKQLYVNAVPAIGGGAAGDARRYTNENSQYIGPSDGGNSIVTISGNAIVRTGSFGGGGAGTYLDGSTGKLGFAKVYISGNADVQGQAVMAKGGTDVCRFEMTGGLLSLSDNSYEFVKKDGGAVWMDEGVCILSGGTISDFNAQNGGAVYMEGGLFTMSGGTIRNCRANYSSSTDVGGNGGAVYIKDATGSATLNITGGTISGNYADWNGGAVYLEGGNVNISGGTVTVNNALGKESIGATEKGNGGGIYLMEGNLTMSGGVVSGNKATRNGGGLYVSSSSQNITVNITGGEITGNVAENYGAGLFVLPKAGLSAMVNIGVDDATYSRLLPKITGNSASLRGGGIYAQSTSGDPANPNAVLNLYDGKIKDNYVSAYVYNQSISNEGGSVTLALDDDGKPVPDLDYITVTIDPAGGDFTDGNTSADPAYRYLVKSSNSILAIPTPKRKNFRFIGWLPSQGEADTKVAVYTDGMTFNYDKDLTLTAQWAMNN